MNNLLITAVLQKTYGFYTANEIKNFKKNIEFKDFSEQILNIECVFLGSQ